MFIDKINSAKISILIDNCSGCVPDILAQHAFSVLIDVTSGDVNKKILFDVGHSAFPILHNMRFMNIALNDIDAIVLSHCHHDHVSGLVDIIKKIDKNIPIYAHSNVRGLINNRKYLADLGIAKKNNYERILANGGQLIFIKDPAKLLNGAMITGQVVRSTRFESVLEDGNVSDCVFKEKFMPDDMSLILNINDKGLLIVSACSHIGIINIIKYAVAITGVNKIYGIMGGLHLLDATAERINKTVEALKEMNIQFISVGHCTGLKAIIRLVEEFGDKTSPYHAGKEYILA